jgi:hypothetical protein
MQNGQLSFRGRLLALTLALWGLVTVVPELARVFLDYGTIGIEADNDGRIYSVDDRYKTASDQAIAVGDRIDLRRTRFGDLISILGGMGGMQYTRTDTTVSLFIVPGPSEPHFRAAGVRILTAQPKPADLVDKILLALESLGAMFFIGVGLVLVWRRPSRMTWGFFLYGIWFNPGQYFVFYAELQRFPSLLVAQEVAQAAAEAAGYAGFVVFALRFPGDRVSALGRRIEGALPAIAAILFLLQLYSFAAVFGLPTEWGTRVSYLAGYAVDLLVLVILRIRTKSQTPADRQRTRWVQWGCRVGLASFIFADSNEATTMWLGVWQPPEKVLALFYLANLTVAFAVFHAVRRHRVIDVSFAVSRGTTLLLTWLATGGVLAVVGSIAEDVLREFVSRVLLVSVAVVVMTLLFEWIHEQLNHLCDRFFFPRLHHARHIFPQVQTRLSSAIDHAEVDRVVVHYAFEQLGLASAAVLHRCSAEHFRRSDPSFGWPPATDDIVVPATLEQRLSIAQDPVPVDAPSEIFRDMLSGPAQPVLAVPIHEESKLSAIALFGSHASGADLIEEEHSLLGGLAKDASAAYDRIVARELRAENERLRTELRARSDRQDAFPLVPPSSG